MMSQMMNNVIRLAIEKGGWLAKEKKDYCGNRKAKIHIEKQEWKYGIDYEVSIGNGVSNFFISTWTAITQDPLFWQALGKALGWTDDEKGKWGNLSYGEWKDKHWRARAHQYFALVLTGGDTEKFWKELIAVSNDRQ